MLRIEEMEVFIPLLNSLCQNLSKPYYFLISKSPTSSGWQAQLAKELKAGESMQLSMLNQSR